VRTRPNSSSERSVRADGACSSGKMIATLLESIMVLEDRSQKIPGRFESFHIPATSVVYICLA
jgi:hypothetical protein